MSLGQIFVMVAGLEWIVSAILLREISRLLGPSFHTTKTVNAVWRVLAFAAALICFVRGLTLWFPGQLVETSRISVMAPLGGLVPLGLSAVVLDWVMRDRAPPPWSETILRLVGLIGLNGPVKVAAMLTAPAAIGDVAPTDAVRGSRSRLLVLIGAILVATAVAVFLIVSAPARGGV